MLLYLQDRYLPVGALLRFAAHLPAFTAVGVAAGGGVRAPCVGTVLHSRPDSQQSDAVVQQVGTVWLLTGTRALSVAGGVYSCKGCCCACTFGVGLCPRCLPVCLLALFAAFALPSAFVVLQHTTQTRVRICRLCFCTPFWKEFAHPDQAVAFAGGSDSTCKRAVSE